MWGEKMYELIFIQLIQTREYILSREGEVGKDNWRE